jgi:hypothetical protein
MGYPSMENGRVSNAILATKLDALYAEVRGSFVKLERRIDFLEEKVDVRISAVEDQGHANGTNIARLDERQKATTGILGAMTAIGSAVAAALGVWIK